MNDQERLNILEVAEENLQECIDNLRAAMKGTNEEHYAERYIIGHLRCWLDSSDFGGRDTGIKQLQQEVLDGDIYEQNS